MIYFRVATLLMVVLIITACGRRLPDEYFEVDSDFPSETIVSTPTLFAIAPTPTNVTIDTTEANSEEQTADETNTDETAVVDEAPSEQQFELVEVPLDPIVEQVADADPTNGEALLVMGVPCTSCHNFDSENMLVGPGMLNIPTRAESRIEGVVAERYLYNSIVHPNDYIVEGFSQGVMPQVYTDLFSENELLDIVAYLMTLGNYPEREPSFIEVPIEIDDTVATEETADEVQETDDTDPSDDANVVYIVITATPMTDLDNDPVEDEESTDENASTSEAMSTDLAVVAPNYDIDLSGVPASVDFLASRGVVENGEAFFNEALVNGMSCSTCHSVDGQPSASQIDLSTVGTVENSSAYIWAAIFNNQLHPCLSTQYQQQLSGASPSHLVAYLQSLSVDE